MKDLVLASWLALCAPATTLAMQSPGVLAPPPAAAQHTEQPEALSPGDWASIRAVYETNRHAAFPTEDGFEVYNPGLGWRTSFDGSKAITRPDEGDWTWGLELARWGYEGGALEVGMPQALHAEGQRVSREWDDALTEWWVNDTRGLEHGFTVHAAPADKAASSLAFELRVLGGLQPKVNASKRGASFVAEDGAAVLTYDGLLAFDADGVDLTAWMEATEEGLRLIVNTTDARYPITIDPLVQMAYWKASNTDSYDSFGSVLAVSGDTVVVGARTEQSNATGVNPGAAAEANNFGSGSGAAYVFVRSGSVWSQQAYIKASNTGLGDHFGWSVAISGDVIVVGAPAEASRAKGVNSGPAAEADDGRVASGAAYIFVRSGSVWSQQAYLKASNTGYFDAFGTSVAVDGNTVVVGAVREDSSATGVNPGAAAEADNSTVAAGAVYVFERTGSVWSQDAYIKASNSDSLDTFGSAVAIEGDTLLVGAALEDSSASGVNPGAAAEADNSANGAGAVYVFARSGSGWSQEAYVKASNTDSGDVFDFFGGSLALSGDTMVVGAQQEDSGATGVNPGPEGEADNNSSTSGAVYVYVRSGSGWSQQAYLKASNTGENDYFGYSVAVSGDALVVGARKEDSGATGVNSGDIAEADNSETDAGAAYVFVRSGSVWFQHSYIKAANTGEFDLFGNSVAILDDGVFVGAAQESSGATGINPGPGAEADDSAFGAGAVYMLEGLPSPLGTSICSPAVPNSTGNPASLTALGSDITLDNDVTFVGVDLPPSAMTILATSPSLGTVIGAGGGAGTLCIASPFIGRHGVIQSNASGEVVFAVDLTAIPLPNSTTAVMAGDTRYWQFWYRDNGTSNFSDAIQIDFQ